MNKTHRITGDLWRVFHYDIALLKLAEEVDISVYTPVCLPILGEDYVSPDRQGNYQEATAAGKVRCKKPTGLAGGGYFQIFVSKIIHNRWSKLNVGVGWIVTSVQVAFVKFASFSLLGYDR